MKVTVSFSKWSFPQVLSSTEVKDKQYVARIRGDLDVQDAADDRYSQIRSEDAEQKRLVDQKLVRDAQKVFGGSAMLSAAPQHVAFANRRTLPSNGTKAVKLVAVSKGSNKHRSRNTHSRLNKFKEAKQKRRNKQRNMKKKIMRRKNALHAKHEKQHYEKKKSMTEKASKKDKLFNQDILDLQQVKRRITKVSPLRELLILRNVVPF